MRFSSVSRSDRLALYILLGGTAFVAFAIVASLWFLSPLLTHLYGVALYAHLIKLRRHHGPLDYASFFGNSRVLFSRLCLLAAWLRCSPLNWEFVGKIYRNFSTLSLVSLHIDFKGVARCFSLISLILFHAIVGKAYK
jgi:hypothetical protein